MNVAGPVAPPRLHVPEEPPERERWRAAVLAGADPAVVVGEPGGVAEWLWRRWQVLAQAGMGAEAFEAAVTAYRRELWLWLAGERTWGQCCSGLIGRVERRLGQSTGTSRSSPVSTS